MSRSLGLRSEPMRGVSQHGRRKRTKTLVQSYDPNGEAVRGARICWTRTRSMLRTRELRQTMRACNMCDLVCVCCALILKGMLCVYTLIKVYSSICT